MTEKILSESLQQLMQIHGNISVSDLARQTGIPQPTLHHVLSGATKNPRKKSLEVLAKFFAVSVNQLMGHEPLPNIIPEAIKTNLKIRTIPIIPWELLKDWPSRGTQSFNEILLDTEVAENSFAVIMPNASMEPAFRENSLLIFDYGKCIADRDFVVLYVNKSNEILFNRVFVDNDEYFIKQHLQDGNMKLVKFDPAIDRIIGTLVEVRLQKPFG